jgi:hypothetical protein
MAVRVSVSDALKLQANTTDVLANDATPSSASHQARPAALTNKLTGRAPDVWERNMKPTAAALLVVAGLSWQAQAETLALRCEGTKITNEIKDPGIGELSPGFRDLSAGEEDKGAKDARTEERASTDVILTDQMVYAFGVEFETGYTNDAFIRFGRSANNPELTGFVLEGFFGEINRIAGTLEAEQVEI